MQVLKARQYWQITVSTDGFGLLFDVHTQFRLAFFPFSPLGLNVFEVNGAIPDMPSRKTMWAVLWKVNGQRIKQRGFPPDEGDFFPLIRRMDSTSFFLFV